MIAYKNLSNGSGAFKYQEIINRDNRENIYTPYNKRPSDINERSSHIIDETKVEEIIGASHDMEVTGELPIHNPSES